MKWAPFNFFVWYMNFWIKTEEIYVFVFTIFIFKHNDLFNHRGQWSVLLFAVLLLLVDISYSCHISNSSAGTWADADAAAGWYLVPNRVSFNVKLANFVHLAAFLYRHSHLLPLPFFLGRHLWCLVFGSLVLQVNMELLNSSWFWHNHMIYNVYHNKYLIYYFKAISELLWTANDEHY